MKKCIHFYITILLCCFSIIQMHQMNAQIIYVDSSATGSNDGTSWVDAFNLLDSALTIGASGDTVWVAKGTYFPTRKEGGATDRDKAFFIDYDIKLFGGFHGSETMISQRDWELNKTILSGDIGVKGVKTDNVYHVVRTVFMSHAGCLDGFTITLGYANVNTLPKDLGAGMYNVYSSPSLVNCRFIDNWASQDGAAIYNDSYCSYRLFNCTFTGNHANRNGGAIYNYQHSNPTIDSCLFVSNSVNNDGGAILNYFISNPNIINTVFDSNIAQGRGGAIMNDAESSPSFTDCTFSFNFADDEGGAVHNTDHGDGTFTRCTFNQNETDGSGGAVKIVASDPIFEACVFNSNESVQIGGAVVNAEFSNTTFNRCNFYQNYTLNSDGGAVYNLNNSSPSFNHCTFDQNNAQYSGGAVSNGTSSNPIFKNCIFVSNTTNLSAGGAISNTGGSNPQFLNSTFHNNAAHAQGGAFFNYQNSDPKLTNTILWKNFASGSSNSTSASFFNESDCDPHITYCLIDNSGGSGSWNASIGIDGGNNIDSDPHFISEPDNVQLRYGSPAITGGINDSLDVTDTLDLLGNVRIINSIVDMGAYEFTYMFPCGSYDTLAVDDTPIFGAVYRANNTLSSTGTININSGGPVTFETTMEIVLGPGFESQIGQVLIIRTADPCMD